jgi:glycine/D-amino acid oxidase-like deaminating enzyme
MSRARADHFNAVVIGAGFYGCLVALYLMRERKLRRVAIIEREKSLMKRASYNNQARVHNGYHYPRSFTTAYRSRCSLPRFVKDWPDAIYRDFSHIYAMAREGSRITSGQFRHFCKEIGASIEPVSSQIKSYFERRLIEDVFIAEEPAFDSAKLATIIARELYETGVEMLYDSTVTHVQLAGTDELRVTLAREGQVASNSCTYLFNCGYSGLSQIQGVSSHARGLRHEIAELALVQVPKQLTKIGVTVMDGPFFSLMPFPSKDLHTLSHVRYTPHRSFIDKEGMNPYAALNSYSGESRFERMKRDAERYMPIISGISYQESLLELKTILAQNESDDGRPILFKRHEELPGMYSIMGGKIDNVYDILERLDQERIVPGAAKTNRSATESA